MNGKKTLRIGTNQYTYTHKTGKQALQVGTKRAFVFCLINGTKLSTKTKTKQNFAD